MRQPFSPLTFQTASDLEAQCVPDFEIKNELLHRALAQTPDGSVNILDRDLRYLYAAGKGWEEAGIQTESLIGRNLQELYPKEVVEYVEPFYRQGLEGQNVTFDFHLPPKWYTVNVAPIRDAQGRIEALITIAQDSTQRKNTEEALKRLATIVESSNDAIFSIASNHLITSWNQAAEYIYGYSAQEVIGQPFSRLWATEQEGEANCLFARVLDGEQIQGYKIERLRQDGQLTFIDLTLFPLPNEFGHVSGISGIARDITAQKQASEAQARLAAIVESSTDAISSFDEQGFFTSWNQGAERLYGYKPAEILGQHVTVLSPGRLKQETPGIIDQLHQGNSIRNFETQRQRKDGFLVDISLSLSPVRDAVGDIVGYSAIARDIGPQKQAEEALRRSEQLYHTLAYHFPNGSVYLLDCEGHVLVAEGRGLSVVGLTSQEIVGKTPREIFRDPQLCDQLEAAHQRAVRGEECAFDAKINGRLRFVQLVPVPDETGAISIILAMTQDITERKQFEESLRQSQARLARAQQVAHLGYIEFDFNTQEDFWSDEIFHLLGVEPHSIQPGFETLYEFIHPEDQELARENAIHLLSNGRGFEDEHRIIRQDGEIRWFQVQAETVRQEEAGIARMMCTVLDITERKQSQNEQIQLNLELEHQRRRLDEILSHVPGIVWENSIDRRTMEQEVRYVSNYVEQMLGYSQDEWLHLPTTWPQALHPEDRERVLTESRTIIEEERGGILQYRLIAKDGRAIWTETHCAVIRDADNTITGLRGVTMDITERMHALEEQSRLATLLEATTDFVGWVDTEKRLQYLNPAGRAMLGLTSEESVEGRSISEFSPAYVYDLLVNVAYPTATKTGSWSGEAPFQTQQGQEVPVSHVLTAHRDASGQIVYYSTVARDISESKRAQDVLAQANEELEARVAERTVELDAMNRELRAQVIEKQMAAGALNDVVEMLDLARIEAEAAQAEAETANAAKSEFLSRMSHELRTPLNAILGFGQLLQRSSLKEGQKEQLDLIVEAGEHLLDLINEVLDIAKVETGNIDFSIEPVRVSEVVSEALALVLPLAQRQRVSITDEGGLAEHFALCDRQRLKQILLNLLSNAIKYNHADGRVTVQHGLTNNGVFLTVTNTGPGIAPDSLHRLFTPFERLGKEMTQTEGTGLGLTLTKRLVEAMQGSISVESRVGGNTIFRLTLPGVSNPNETLTSYQRGQSHDKKWLSEKHSVLYIEDNLSNLRLLENISSLILPLHLIPAMQGGLGIDLAREIHPDLILLDIHLPDMNGAEVLKCLQTDETTRDIPVVVLSADATPGQIERLRALGAREYLTKPLDLNRFVSVLEELLPPREI